MAEQYFPYDVDTRWKAMFFVLGVTDDHGVTVGDDGAVVVTYGRKRIETTVSNIDHTEVSGPHRWYTAVGLRLSLADDGLTMGTNHRLGLCMAFVEKIPKVMGFKAHSALWVSVADPEGLAEALKG